MEDIKLFDKYPSTGIEVRDPGLKNYINIRPIFVPRTYGRGAVKKFGKADVHIVERLIAKLQSPGHKGKKHWRTSEFCTGKTATTTNLVRNTFEIIEKKTNKNPVEILVRAVENSAPREEVTVVEMGGIRIPKQVDTSPMRRVDISLRWIVQGTFQATVNKKVRFEESLANEIIAASADDPKSFAISKMNETERQAAASK
jgi:small subunit ribosomal protein S7